MCTYVGSLNSSFNSPFLVVITYVRMFVHVAHKLSMFDNTTKWLLLSNNAFLLMWVSFKLQVIDHTITSDLNFSAVSIFRKNQ